MKRQKICSAFLAAVMLFSAAGCSTIAQNLPASGTTAADMAMGTTTAVTTTTMTSATTTTTTTTQLTGPTFTEVSLEVPYLDIQDVTLDLQAEELELPISFEMANERPGYTGSGYVSGLQGALCNTLVFRAEIPASQHYDISLIACTDTGAECTIFVDDEEVGAAAIEGTGKFISATARGIYMDAGTVTITIQQESGDMLLDCISLCNNTSLIPNRYVNAFPNNPDASAEAVQLWRFLSENYGQKLISGQHVSDSSNSEIRHIVETTGKFPAIRFADLYPYSGNGGDPENADVADACLSWAEQGGIVGLMWHWSAPVDEPSVFTEETAFRLSDAVSFEDIACATEEELQAMCDSGLISKACLRMMQDIDSAASALKTLCDADVPVLWHPLHQAGSGLYWWESDGSDVYKWLWNIMYTRMTEYHALDNLLWVWSGLDADYLPDAAYYDIAAADIYAEEAKEIGSGFEAYYAMQEMAYGKIIALSECSMLPDVNTAFRDGSVWSYFGLWYAPYLSAAADETLIAVYNSEGVLTREDYAAYCAEME